MGPEDPAALPASASCLPAPWPGCTPRAREPCPLPSLDLTQARKEFPLLLPVMQDFSLLPPHPPARGQTRPRAPSAGRTTPVVSHRSPGQLCSLLPAGGGGPVRPHERGQEPRSSRRSGSVVVRKRQTRRERSGPTLRGGAPLPVFTGRSASRLRRSCSVPQATYA